VKEPERAVRAQKVSGGDRKESGGREKGRMNTKRVRIARKV
jgi:hypothetical protein